MNKNQPSERHLSENRPEVPEALDGQPSAPEDSGPGPRESGGLRSKIGLAFVSLGLTYFVLGHALWFWYHHFSSSRLSTPEEIEEYHDRGYSFGLYEYHPERQTTLRASRRGLRHGIEDYWMQTDERGLAYLPPNQGDLDILVLGDSVAFGTWLPYEGSFPGLLAQATSARVFSAATESYNLRQSHHLFMEVGGDWDLVLYVWVPNDFYEWRFRETPFEPFPRGGLARPLDLFDFRDLRYRFFDLLSDRPEGLGYDEALAWNRRRYPEHLRRIAELNRDGNLVVILTYLAPQLGTDRLEPQRWLKEGLDDLGVDYVDTLPVYGHDFFVEGDHVHFNSQGTLQWSEFVTRRLVELAPEVLGRRSPDPK